MIFQVLSAPNQPMTPYNGSGGRRAGPQKEPCAFYFLFSFTFPSVFVLELPRSSPSHLRARFVLSCAQQLLGLCPAQLSLSLVLSPQSTGTGPTSAPFSFPAQGFHRSSQPEVKLVRNSPVYIYGYFLNSYCNVNCQNFPCRVNCWSSLLFYSLN